MMGLIKCTDVCKSFGEKIALDHVSVEIPKGKIFGLLGPNGAGKTTLIRIINRITIPNSGEVTFDGRPITQDDVEKIGYLPEERGLYRKMKVGEQAMYFAQLKGMSAREAAVELKKWFVRFGIESWWNKKVEELSKGMAQKVQFITTVVHKPSLLILDEPFSGFDPVNAQIIREEILRLKDEGATIILSTHNMESVEELCDNIALINKSHVVITGGVDEIRRKYGNNNVELIYTSDEAVQSVPGLYTVLSDNDDAGRHTAVLSLEDGSNGNEVLADLLSKDIAINSFKELVPRMNDIFIKLVTEEE
jgi:ABC-2 type transport system ATP-binding protein